MEDKLDKDGRAFCAKNTPTSARAGRIRTCSIRSSVDYYGTMSPINQVGNISVADAKCLVISPWDASLFKGHRKGDPAVEYRAHAHQRRQSHPPDIPRSYGRAPPRPRKADQGPFRRRESCRAQRPPRRDGSAQKDEKQQRTFRRRMRGAGKGGAKRPFPNAIEQIEKHTADKEKEIMSV